MRETGKRLSDDREVLANIKLLDSGLRRSDESGVRWQLNIQVLLKSVGLMFRCF